VANAGEYDVRAMERCGVGIFFASVTLRLLVRHGQGLCARSTNASRRQWLSVFDGTKKKKKKKKKKGKKKVMMIRRTNNEQNETHSSTQQPKTTPK
jgi:hypothetical protein